MAGWGVRAGRARTSRVLLQRLKTPAPVHQFTHALNKNQATELFKLILKYSPEDKAAKDEVPAKQSESSSAAAGAAAHA